MNFQRVEISNYFTSISIQWPALGPWSTSLLSSNMHVLGGFDGGEQRQLVYISSLKFRQGGQ